MRVKSPTKANTDVGVTHLERSRRRFWCNTFNIGALHAILQDR